MSKNNPENSINRVRHLLDFAARAARFTDQKTRQDLDSNEILAFAVIHLIEMLGEASRGVSPEFRKRYPEVPWEQISGTRNRLAHGYLDVDLDVVWTIVSRDIPSLIKKLKQILKEEDL
jgi:uncharacterized protein with HEPN domain